MVNASCAVTNTSGTLPAVTRSIDSGTRARLCGGHREQLRLTASAGDAEHARTEWWLGDVVAVRDHLARELEPGDVGRRSGGCLVEAGALHEVGAVETGAVDAHEDLTRTGFGIRPFLDPHLLVGDHQCSHGGDRSNGAARPGRARRYGAAVPAADRSAPDVRAADLVVLDADGREVVFDATEARDFLDLTGGLEDATVSACPRCRSRILAVVALADLLDDAPPFARSGELVELADDAPTLHVYVRDLGTRCAHREWRDPGAEEWSDLMIQLAGPAIVR